METHPCVLQDIDPLGPLPCSHSTSPANHSGHRVPLTMCDPWMTCSPSPCHWFFCRFKKSIIFSRVSCDSTPGCVVLSFGWSVGWSPFGQRPWMSESHIWWMSSFSFFSFLYIPAPPNKKQLKISALMPKSQYWSPNSSLDARIPALRPKSQTQSENSSPPGCSKFQPNGSSSGLKAFISASRPKSQPVG